MAIAVLCLEEIKRIYLEVRDELTPIVTGRHLKEWGMEEERTYGDMLEYLYEKQLEEKFYDLEGAKALYLRKLKKNLTCTMAKRYLTDLLNM